MSMYRTGTVAAPITIIGNDLDAGATLNADLNPNAGIQKAGRFMAYDPATQHLTPWDGVADAPGATITGVLADDVDITDNNATVSVAVMIYREGTFLRQELESANNAAIPPGGALDKALADLGIHLVLSYDNYDGLSPVPAGVITYVADKVEEDAIAAAAKAEEDAEAKAARPKEEAPRNNP